MILGGIAVMAGMVAAAGWRSAGAPGHPAAGVHHPDCRMAGAPGLELDLGGRGQPVAVRGLLPAAVRPDDLARPAGGAARAAALGGCS
jgi:hypothetical protein